MTNIINAAILTTASASLAQAKPAADSTKNSKTTMRTGVKSVDEQQAETKANETDKEKAEVEHKASDSTTTQSKLNDGKITAANISKALTPAKTDEKANSTNKPNSAWEQFINSRFQKDTNDLPNTNQINSANQMPSGKELQAQMQNDSATVANNFGLSTPDQNQSSSSQQSQGPSGQALGSGGGPGGNGSGYFNNVVVGNNSGNTTVIGDTSMIGGGQGLIDGPTAAPSIEPLDPKDKKSVGE